MTGLALDSFEQASLGKVKFDVTDKLDGLNKAFKSNVESVEGSFGETGQAMGDAISKTIGRNEVGNAIKEYTSESGKLLSRVENLGDGVTKTLRYDDNGTEYLKEVTDTVKNTTSMELAPNVEIVKENFTARTDQFGRAVSNKITDVQLKDTGREALSDNLKDNSYRINDERGHIIADRLGGPASKENVVAQDFQVNRSSFKQVENTVAKLKNDGHTVDYEVKTNYVGSDMRPSSFEPKITVDGQDYSEFIKTNEGYSEIPEKIYNNNESSVLQKAATNVAEQAGLHHEAGIESAKMAAGITCAMSTVDNVSACMGGEITADEAAINIATDTGKAAVVGYGAGFVSSAVASSMAGSSHQLISSLGNSCVPAAAVSFGIASYDTVIDYAQGDIGTDELAYDLGENAVGVAGSIGGAALAGAAVGSVVPVAGTAAGAAVGLVGGMVGYTVATGAYATAVETAGDAIDEHQDEIKALGDKAQDMANLSVERAAEISDTAAADVRAAINDFNIKNSLPFAV